MTKNTDKKVALFAGALSLPFLTRDILRKNGWDVFVIGLKNFYDERLKPDMVVRLGGGGRALREFKRRGISKMTFVGALGHPNLSDLRPDLWTLFALFRILRNQQQKHPTRSGAMHRVRRTVIPKPLQQEQFFCYCLFSS